MKRSHDFRKLAVRFALAISTIVVVTGTPQVAHAATGIVSGTITAGGVPVPKGTVQIAFVQYPSSSNCLTLPTGQLVAALVGANGTFSQSIDTAFPWKVIFRPLSSAPSTALWRLYKAGTPGGATKFYPDATCMTLTSSGVSNVNLATTEVGVNVSGSLSTNTGSPVTEKATVYLSRTATSYQSTGDGYVVKVGENGAWDINGVDQNQPNLYMQVNLGGTFFSVKKVGDQYQVIPLDANCGADCKFPIASIDISGIKLTLPEIGTIRGTISGPPGTTVGAGQVCAIAYKDGGSAMNMYSLEAARTCTDATGAYTLGLTFGSYRLQFQNMPGAPFKSQWYDQVSNVSGYPGATVIALATGGNASKIINPTLAEGKYIRGRITDANGDPVSGASVNAMIVDPETSMTMGVAGVSTQTDGTYSISGIDAGTYMLMTNHPDYGMMYLGGTRDTATQITIASGSPGATGQDISFPRGYAISGNLTTGDQSEGRICAAAYRTTESNMGWGQFITSNCFTAPGPWKLKGLKEGTYRIRFDAQTGNLRSVFLGGGTDYNSAETRSITDADISNVDVTIPVGKTISGKIMNSGPAVVQGACVTAYKQTSDFMMGNQWAGGSCTSTTGEFTLRGLEDGNYKLRIDPPSNSDYGPGYFTEAGNPTKSQEDAQVFTLGNSISGLNQILLTGPKFTATIKDGSSPVANVCVNAYKKVNNYGWGEWGGSSCSGVDGLIKLRGMSAGEYTFEVRPNAGNYQNGWYVQNLPTTQTKTSASPMTLASIDVSLGDISLSTGTKASGKIVNSDGNPVSGVCIGALKDSLYGWGEWAGSTCTQADGKFTLRGLDPASSYRFRVDVWASDYKPGFINTNIDSNRGVVNSISGIDAIPADTEISIGDVTLSKGPSISGIITSGDSQAESNVCITALDADTLMWKASTCTQGNGKFTLRGLDPGSFKLTWWTPNPLLTNGWYKATSGSSPTLAGTPDSADTLPLTSSGMKDLSIRLANGGKIYGTITGSTSSDICVAAWTKDSIGPRDNATAISCVNSAMSFELKGLTPNTNYYLQVFKKDATDVTQISPSTDVPQQSGGDSVTISVS